jgi:hypothetical protein
VILLFRRRDDIGAYQLLVADGRDHERGIPRRSQAKRIEDPSIFTSQKTRDKPGSRQPLFKPNHLNKSVRGPMSITQLDDGRILFPVLRWIRKTEEWIPETKRNMLNRSAGNHSVFVSEDGGKGFTKAYTTLDHCCEAHIIQLKSGNILGAFPYQRDRR